jgi:hypothetical protein
MSSNRLLGIVLLSVTLYFTIVCLSFARTDHGDYRTSTPQECRDCHHDSGVPTNHGVGFLKEHRVLAQKAGANCYDCHQQSFCQDCHKGGNIDADLRMIPSSKGEYMPRTHTADFISTHPIVAADDRQSCYRCHETKFCSDCHAQVPNRGGMRVKNHVQVGSSLRYNFTGSDHPSDARRDLQTCEGCHPDAQVCSRCHSLTPGASTAKRVR